MKMIEQSHKILHHPNGALWLIELAARTCYKSEARMQPGSEIEMVKRLIAGDHLAMLEFGDFTVKFVTNRGVTHELVRHRLCSFAQESTRFVRYDDEMEFIKPVWWEASTKQQKDTFTYLCVFAEQSYNTLLKSGWTPQQAREVLPNALKTEIVVKANLREWRHIFFLRCSKAAHPQIRALMQALLKELQTVIPVVFDDISEESD